MARGGYRPGAGRPKAGARPAETPSKRSGARGNTPLEYMLAVMRDESADPVRRDRMAIAAAPFVHSRAGDSGKKAEQAAHAKVAEKGSEWAGLLQ